MKRMIALILTVLILSGSIALAQDNSQYSLATITKVPDFSTIDQNGNPVDQSVFANAKYTLLVFWGTWCGPCVEEIPKLAAAVEGLGAIDVQIVGICEDGKTDRETALNILETDNATYVNIMPDDQFYDDFVSLCFSFPSAMLIDSNGNVVQNQFSLLLSDEPIADTFHRTACTCTGNRDCHAPSCSTPPTAASALRRVWPVLDEWCCSPVLHTSTWMHTCRERRLPEAWRWSRSHPAATQSLRSSLRSARH